MKKYILLTALGLLVCSSLAAQTPPQTAPAQGALMQKPERYLYAELIGSHMPSNKGCKVILDFGQETEGWKFNWITDPHNRNIRFNSIVEALNYMIRQKWEFVQAYTSGADNENTHYLLRIRVEELPAEIRNALPPAPSGSSEAE